jgi:hypothetical protein
VDEGFDRALAAHLEALRSLGTPFVRMVKPANYPPEAIRSRLEIAAGSAPAELVSWFSWQDGVIQVPGKPEPAVFGAYLPLGIDRSLDKAAMFGMLPPIPPGLPNPWVPIAADWVRTLVVDARTGRVRLYYDWEFYGEVAESISALLQSWAEFVHAEVIWDEASEQWSARTPWLELDPQLVARIGY